MSNMKELQEAIRIAAQSWPPLPDEGDPNPDSVYHHVKKISELLNLSVPIELPEREIGVKVVKLVEQNMIRGCHPNQGIQRFTPEEIERRALNLVTTIREQDLLPFKPSECYVAALFLWLGCICMAKNLRTTYVIGENREAQYTINLRLQGYNNIQDCWQYEEDRGNPWVRYGVSLASLFEKGEKIDDWVPENSPYWDC